MIARMQIRETAWSQLLFDWQTCEQDPDNCSVPQGIQTLLNTGCYKIIEDAQNPAGFILVNTIGPESRIDELYDYFAAGDKQSIWKWNFNGTVDFATEYTGQHNDILATQPAGSTFEDGNWSHGWVGQGDGQFLQRYARNVSREFGEDFA